MSDPHGVEAADGATPAHYFDHDPSVPSQRRQISLPLPDLTLDLTTDNGVFAADAVDPGTRLLLLEAPAPAPTELRAVDLGCGYGPIALTMAHRAPWCTVTAVEVNSRARELCVHNASAAGLTNVAVMGPNDVPATARFDVLYSNPPIRIGKPALRALLTHWLALLRPGGTAHLVVQKHLGADSLASWLIDQGHEVTRTHSRRAYRLLQVKPPAVVTEAGPT
jgi:16S rRNA G1207 methylase RsmC